MFERRLKILLTVFGVFAIVILGRLAQLQLVHGEYYRQRAIDALELPPKALPFIRGSILERSGEVLVSDEPAWDLTIDYSILNMYFEPGESSLRRELRRWKKRIAGFMAPGQEPTPADFGLLVENTWGDLAAFCFSIGRQPGAAQDRARQVYDQVVTIRQAVARNRGFDAPVAEENETHAILSELSGDQQIAAREHLGKYPWLHVDPSTHRRYAGDTESFAHVLGRMGPVDPDTIARDPNADNPFARYLPSESVGISGVEWAAESRLRGRRGLLQRDRLGQVFSDISAENGHSVRMSLVGPLQRRLYRLLGDAVESHPHSNGGAIVVLDVATREVLALVSYPSYDPVLFREHFETLRDNTERLPLTFRAVAVRYQPGSTIKPLACLSGFFNHIITPESRDECRGALFPENPNAWRCWEIHGTSQRMSHGLINAEEALTGSCNVFLYRLGEKLGVDRLCTTFEMAGVGRSSGIGLREDEPGINPTSSWLARNRNAPAGAGAARQFAIGQAELTMTPVQVANMMATYASGRFRPVTLLLDGPPTPEWTLPGTPDEWSAIRRGIYGVVNEPDGTAYKYAHFEHPRYALCGKTGSATAAPWPTAYRIPFVDEYRNFREVVIPEGAKGPALERFRRLYPLATYDPNHVEVARRWPPHPPEDGGNHAHAWFGGYLQELDSAGRPKWSHTPRIAFAALIEFGGSGGRTSGPLAKQIAAVLIELLGPELNNHLHGGGV